MSRWTTATPAQAAGVMAWHVPPECGGRIVERSYGFDHEGRICRRIYDSSDRSVSYDVSEVRADDDPINCEPSEPKSRAAVSLGRKGGSVRGASKSRGDSAHYRALVAKRYEVRGEWGGYEIRAGRIGWIVERDSRVQGDTTDERIRIGYDLVPATVDLDAAINEMGTTNAQLIVEYATHGQGTLLRRGRRVE